MKTAVIALVTMGLLAGCGKDFGPSSDSVRGPDEFGVVPTAPLQKPDSYSRLPAPAPGGRNLVDPLPKADAIAALGGRQSAGQTGMPASDRQILQATGGIVATDEIRASLAADGGARSPGRQGLLSFGSQSLDAQKELKRLRAAGVSTPSAPPP